MYRNIQIDGCDRYKDIYSINKIDPVIKIRTKKPISSTYDNFTIVSEQFKAFCETEGYRGLEFVVLPNSPGLYWFKIHNIIQYDSGSKGLRFINYNKECRGYEEVIGANPVYLKTKELIPDGFFRTDLCFGSFERKFPLMLVGTDTMKKIKSAGFKGLDISEVKDVYD
ncbi:MAG: hypothetical protein ACTHMI_22110 [Mucilaginibacter sp.]